MKCPQCHRDNPQDTQFCGHCASPLTVSDGTLPFVTKTLQFSAEELTVGGSFAGRYQILEELGQGGMGRVYLAMDKELEEKIALKLINPKIAADERTLQRFRNELKLARQIVHKNVCRMFDLSKYQDVHYLTMEYVPGENLKNLLKRVGALSVGKALAVAIQICAGLEEAHRLGVIHRDLKPQNIMIDREGNVRIMDFGIARSLAGKGLTDDGQLIGTLEYMSPEQLEGKKADERSDIYSVGVIVYEMVTGRLPFEGETPISIAAKHINAVPPEPRNLAVHIPEGFSQTIMRCLEKDRDQRYQTAEALGVALREIESSIPATQPIRPPQKAPTSRVIGRSGGRKKILIPAIAVAVVAIGLTWLFVFRKNAPRVPTATPQGPRSEDILQAGKAFWESKNYGEAARRFGELLAREPNNFEARFGLASVLDEQGKTSEAIPEFERAIVLNPSDARPYRSLAAIHEQREDMRKALDYYREYLRRAPPMADIGPVGQKIVELEARLAPVPKPAAKESPIVNPATRRNLSETPERQNIPAAERDINAGMDTVRQAFKREDYQACLDETKKILDLDQNHAEAKKYRTMAGMKLAPQQVSALVQRYVQAFNDKALLSFYRENSSPELFQLVRKDVELILSQYDNFKTVASNIDLRFQDASRAEAGFSSISTGELKSDRRKQVLFEGTLTWSLEKRGDRWTIIRITNRPAEKK